jgi:hypothetical protein
MIALGTVPPDTAPSWIHITPAASGSFYWSGTKTLIFSPDASTPLPFATTFTVLVDAAATSVSGHALATPYSFTFTTPTVRLLEAKWYRRGGRFDAPAVIALRFNQRVRPEDVVAHAHVALEPYAWTAPVLAPEARRLWRRTDPAGLKRFDDKVAAVQRVTSRSTAIGVRVAGSWDEDRFPGMPEQVVVETTTAPPPDGRLRITIDATLPSPDGPATHAAQSTVVTLEPTFFVKRVGCEFPCSHRDTTDPAQRPRREGAFARALTIVDVTDPAHSARESRPGVSGDTASQLTIQPRLRTPASMPSPLFAPGGFGSLRICAPAMARRSAIRVGFVENMHEQSFIAFEGSVWEASGGRWCH